MSTNYDLLKIAYKAFNNRNIDAVLAVMHPDVDWQNGMEGGRLHGHQKVRDYWMRQFSLINSHVEPLRFEVDKFGLTIVDVHQIIRDLNGNVIADDTIEHIFRIENGLVKSMNIEAVEKQDL
jgi:translation elongation factor EF-1beta